jgi:DNA-binding NarL/FixJ family response regulator
MAVHHGPMSTFDSETKFTDRQRQVVRLIAEGCSNIEIAERLGISPRTAKAHSDTLRTKLGVPRRRQIPAAYRMTTGENPHEIQSLKSRTAKHVKARLSV